MKLPLKLSLNKIYLYAIFVVLLGLFISLFIFTQRDKSEKIMTIGDKISHNFRAGLDYEMADLLSFAMALSEDGALKKAIIKDDETQGYQILSHISQRFKKYTHIKSLRIQVLTMDFFIFARSWNEGFEGMPIWWFRDDLDRLKKYNQPKVGMETGRLLTFKATVPIYSGKKLLAYIEVIKFVDEFASKLRKKGIELFALMNEKYLKNAELMRDFPRLNGYVVSNQNYNQLLLKGLKEFDLKTLISKNWVYDNKNLYIYEPMYNGKDQKIGIYLLIISNEILNKYNQNNNIFEQFSDRDIEKVVESWRNPNGNFHKKEDKDLIQLLPKLKPQDKNKLEDKAREMLNSYTKDELIDIILDTKQKEKKIGIIR